jgi:hypothetical protein
MSSSAPLSGARPEPCVLAGSPTGPVDFGKCAGGGRSELLLATHVTVERAGDHPKTRAQCAHGQRLDALLGDHRECLVHHALPGERAAELPIGFRSVERSFSARDFGGEPDWDTLVLSGNDLATQRAIARARADSFRRPDLGRRLAALFVEAGLELQGLHVIAFPFRDLAVAESILMLSGAVEIVGTDAARAWCGQRY